MSNEENAKKREDLTVVLPPMNGKGDCYPVKGKTSIVLIGANGVGKTRMSSWIEQHIIDNKSKDIRVHRVSAQKSLRFPDSVDSTDVEKARDKVLYGSNKQTAPTESYVLLKGDKYNGDPNTNLLNDVESVMKFLVSDHADKSISYRYEHLESQKNHTPVDDANTEKTYIEIIADIWNSVVSDKELKAHSGNISASVNDIGKKCDYDICQLSDGEREIVYLLGEVLAAYPGTLIIIDEPEEHLHKALLSRFWNEVEKLRKDCVFLYITHDYDFALSRINSELIWVHGIHNNPDDKKDPVYWDYESLSNPDRNVDKVDEKTDEFVDEARDKADTFNALMLEICGSTKDVLLVEGESNSPDWKLYSKIYPEYDVIPVDGCEEVIREVIGCRKIQRLHHIKVVGIVDGDRRFSDDIAKLQANGIYVLKVAQVENLFMLPKVFSLIHRKVGSKVSLDVINDEVRRKTLEHLEKAEVSNREVLLYTKEKLRSNIDAALNDKNLSKIKDPDVFYEALKKSFSGDASDFARIGNEKRAQIQQAITEKNFEKALALDSNKGLLNYTLVSNYFGWNAAEYKNRIYLYLDDSDISEELRAAFKEYIGLK